jgi:hypothetical protein
MSKWFILGAALTVLAGGCRKKEAAPGSPDSPLTAPRVTDAGSGGAAPTGETPVPPEGGAAMDLQVRPDIADRVARYARVHLRADLSSLSEADRAVLAELRRAADVMGELAFRQTWSGNETMRVRVAELEGPLAQAAKDLFRIMGGPWDRQDDYLPFVGDTPHPKGSAFYPEDLTVEEFESWISAHPADAAAFRGYFTVVERRDGGLVAVPYAEAYRELLEPAAESLRRAAALAGDEALRKYLTSRADAFLSNDYYASDLDWLDLDGSLEVVLGPYETYDDGLMGYKASFEAFLCMQDPEASAALDRFKAEVPFLEANLPIPEEHRNPSPGMVIPIRVVDELYATGQAGVMTVAFNLPNDQRVKDSKGFKNVLLRNVMQAKYDAILVPIAERALPPEAATGISFDAFFHFVLFHEISHGLGPGRIVRDGRETDVRTELRELYSAIEEAKADTLSLFVQGLLAEKGLLPQVVVDSAPQTYVAGIFRTIRFGISESHGKGMVAQVNFLMEKGAVRVTDDGRFEPVPENWSGAVRDLAHELLLIEALGDYQAARAFLDRYAAQPPAAMLGVIESLGAGIPVDIAPVFPEF